MQLSELNPERPRDFAFGLVALAVLITAFFLLGGADAIYHQNPLVITLGFLALGVLYFIFDAFFGPTWGK